MMTDEPALIDEANGVSSSIAASARMERRKAALKRRMFSALIGVALVVALVFWQRSRSGMQQCHTSIGSYGKASANLGANPELPELIETSWLAMDTDAPLQPNHYHVLVDNWHKRPAKGDAIPLAVCRQAHSALIGGGRYVLYRTESGLETRWIAEEDAAAIVPQGSVATD